MTRERASEIYFSIRRRPWYVWLGRGAWTVWLVLWLEIAIGSYKETELHAFRQSMKVWLASLLLGTLLYAWGRRREAPRAGEESGKAQGPSAGDLGSLRGRGEH